MNDLKLLDMLAIISFCVQMNNNEELHKQSTNDEILKTLHNDVMESINDNRELCNKIIEQNELIIQLLGGGQNTQGN